MKIAPTPRWEGCGLLWLVLNELMKDNLRGDGYSVVPVKREESKLDIESKNGVDRKIHHVISEEDNVMSVTITESNLYKEMFDKKNYLMAYNTIKSKPGNSTPGSDKKSLDGFSMEWIDNIIHQMKTREFQFKPALLKYIEKKDGKKRKLGIPTPKDKIVQKVYYNILSEIYEKIFLPTSNAYRPNKGCHTALKEIKSWSGTTWMIKSDINSFFDNINHNKLADILKKNIKNKNMIDFYWKLVKAGYIEENGKYKVNSLGIPQGGVVSPLLSNIYLHEFDVFMDKLMLEHNDNETSKAAPDYVKLETKLRAAVRRHRKASSAQTLKDIKDLRKQLQSTKSVIRIGTKVKYVRYADDWVVGIIGPLSFAEEIKSKIEHFLKNELLLELNPDKTTILNLNQDCCKFLGYKIKTTTRKYYESRIIKTKNSTRRAPFGRIKFYLPTEDIVKRLEEKGFVKDNKGVYYGPWINLHDKEIIIAYRNVLAGIYRYYSLADDLSRFNRIEYLIQFSAAHTIAAKHRTSIAKVFLKYGRKLKIPIDKSFIDLDFRNIKSTKSDIWEDPLKITSFLIRQHWVLGDKCKLCGTTEKVEMHHIRRLKDLNPKLSSVHSMMAKMRRKQIPVCRPCHMRIHSGKHSGEKL